MEGEVLTLEGYRLLLSETPYRTSDDCLPENRLLD